jgi:hypothetical protein
VFDGVLMPVVSLMDTHARTSDGTPTTSITSILLHCEATLRALHGQGRLTAESLQVFGDLAERMRRAVDRRDGLDRRVHPRTSRDRRRCSQVARPQRESSSGAARETLGIIRYVPKDRAASAAPLISTAKDRP